MYLVLSGVICSIVAQARSSGGKTCKQEHGGLDSGLVCAPLCDLAGWFPSDVPQFLSMWVQNNSSCETWVFAKCLEPWKKIP